MHESTICPTVQRLGFTRKKLQHIAFGCSKDLRAKGYSLRGKWAEDHQLKLGRTSVNAITIMSHEGVYDIYLTEEKVNGEIFECFVAIWLVPRLMPSNGINNYSIVIMDNCSVHLLEGKCNPNDSKHRCPPEVFTTILIL